MSPPSYLDADASPGTGRPCPPGGDAGSERAVGAGAAPHAECGAHAGPRERRRRTASDVERAQPADSAPDETAFADPARDGAMRDEAIDVDEGVDEGLGEAVDEGGEAPDDPDAR